MAEQPGTVDGEAGSFDGRRFTFRTSRATPLVPGDVVVIEPPGDGRLVGQVFENASTGHGDDARDVTGLGSLIGTLEPDGAVGPVVRQPFPEAAISSASADVLEALQVRSAAGLEVGTWRSGQAETTARLRVQGFNRHSFLCGQSGSGKTYALGVLLEQLILETDLRMVILDPNADFLRLGEAMPSTPPEQAARINAADVRVLRPDGDAEHGLRLRFATMPPHAQAAVLRLDPVRDRGEYNRFLEFLDRGTRAEVASVSLEDLVRGLMSGDADDVALAQRMRNLGLTEWTVWARALPSAAEVVRDGARVTVMDLGGFTDRSESQALCLDVVESLWAERHRRTPTLIVIDEAHNVCPSEPDGPVASAIVDRLVQIAAEGRKFGLWLFLSSQRPSKIHPQVLSQCDNLALMRMNSPGDVAQLASMFGFTPPAMLAAAPTFAQGEVLFAGGFVPTPSFARIGPRLTYQGGSDVSVPVLTDS